MTTAPIPSYARAAPWPGAWAREAACAGLQPLHDDTLPGEPVEEREARYRRAAEVCRVCPVQAQCAEWRAETPIHARTGVSAGRVRQHGQRGETDLLAPPVEAVA